MIGSHYINLFLVVLMAASIRAANVRGVKDRGGNYGSGVQKLRVNSALEDSKDGEYHRELKKKKKTKGSKDKAYTTECGSDVLSDLPDEQQPVVENAQEIFGTVCKAHLLTNEKKMRKELMKAARIEDDNVQFCVSFNGDTLYSPITAKKNIKCRSDPVSAIYDSPCGNCAVAIAEVGGSVGDLEFGAYASYQNHGSCNRALATSQGTLGDGFATAGPQGGGCNLAIMGNIGNVDNNKGLYAGAGMYRSDGNIAVATNYAANALVYVEAGAAGSVFPGDGNIGVASNYAEEGTAVAKSGNEHYSSRNKATAITTAEAGKKAETVVDVAHNANQDDSGAQLVNTAGGCQQAVVPYEPFLASFNCI